MLAEKPLISEETDLLEPSLLDQLVCHIGSLASVYHKPPSSFVDITKHPLRTANVATGLALNSMHNLTKRAVFCSFLSISAFILYGARHHFLNSYEKYLMIN